MRSRTTGYQPLGLQDIKTTKQLNQEAVRDILCASSRYSELQIVTMGQLTDIDIDNKVESCGK